MCVALHFSLLSLSTFLFFSYLISLILFFLNKFPPPSPAPAPSTLYPYTAQPLNGGRACPNPDTETCCIVDCISTWNAWSACDQSTSKKTRSALVTRPASGGGIACPANEEQTCVPPPLEPASCSTISDPSTFCAAFNFALIESASYTTCSSSRCTITSDAATCCKPKLNAAKCDSISDPTGK